MVSSVTLGLSVVLQCFGMVAAFIGQNLVLLTVYGVLSIIFTLIFAIESFTITRLMLLPIFFSVICTGLALKMVKLLPLAHSCTNVGQGSLLSSPPLPPPSPPPAYNMPGATIPKSGPSSLPSPPSYEESQQQN